MEEERIVIGNPRPALTREQKVGLSFVIVCGVGALVLGGLYLWRHMAIPFVIEYEGPRLFVGEEEESAQIAKEKAADTDGDTISDYDERYIYKSSAYIADTDSDGLRDDVEIMTGGDPNCATGDSCEGILEDEDALRDEGASGTFLGDIEPPTPPEGMNATTGEITPDSLNQLKDLPVQEIRNLLIESGADPAKVNALSDAEVQALYAEIIDSLTSETP